MVKVSIIVPVYNVEKYIDRCMDSLLNQTLRDIEVILVDDESPDNCPKICDDYARRDSRVKVVHKKNGGLGYARNSGMEIATGEYVAFVDSDDYVEREAYGIMYKEAKKHNADFVICGYKRIKDGRCLYVYEGDTKSKYDTFVGDECIEFTKGMIGIDNKSERFRHFSFSVWHGVYRRRLIVDNNVTFCSERDYISEDMIFHLSFLPFCNIIRQIPQPLYLYCLNEGTLTTKYKPGRFEAIKKFCAHVEEMIEESGDGRLLSGVEKRTDHLFMSKTWSTASYEVQYNRNRRNAVAVLRAMCNDKTVKKIFRRYDVSELGFKEHTMALLIRWNMPLALYWLFKIRHIGN